MSSGARTFWRRFFLLEPKTDWTAPELKRCPELRSITPNDPYFSRGAAVRRFLRTTLPELGVIMAALTVCCLILGLIARATLGAVSRLPTTNPLMLHPWIAGGVVVFAVLQYGVITAVVAWWGRLRVRRERHRLRSELRCRGMPICLKCGYEGGDINAPKCPECGAPSGA